MNPPVLNDDGENRPIASDSKFDVGWQKLTKEEFVEALTQALLEKIEEISKP